MSRTEDYLDGLLNSVDGSGPVTSEIDDMFEAELGNVGRKKREGNALEEDFLNSFEQELMLEEEGADFFAESFPIESEPEDELAKPTEVSEGSIFDSIDGIVNSAKEKTQDKEEEVPIGTADDGDIMVDTLGDVSAAIEGTSEEFMAGFDGSDAKDESMGQKEDFMGMLDGDGGFSDFGDGGFGDSSFGDGGFGNDGFGDTSFGNDGFGDTEFGDGGFGNDSFGDTEFGSAGLEDGGFGDEGFGEFSDDMKFEDEFSRQAEASEEPQDGKKKKKKEKKEKDKNGGFFRKLSQILFGPDEEEAAANGGMQAITSIDGLDGFADGQMVQEIDSETLEALKAIPDADVSKEKKQKEKEEKKKKKQEEKAKKAKEKKEKQANKAKEKKEKQAKKAAKPKKEKKPKKPKEVDNTPPLPKVPVILIFIMAGSFLALVMIGTNLLGYSNTMAEADKEYGLGNYEAAFGQVAGMEVKEEDLATYEKYRVMANVSSEYNAYQSFMGASVYDMALDSLVRAVGRSEKYAADAESYGCAEEFAGLGEQAVAALDSFGITKDRALELFLMENREDYSVALYKILAQAGFEKVEE